MRNANQTGYDPLKSGAQKAISSAQASAASLAAEDWKASVEERRSRKVAAWAWSYDKDSILEKELGCIGHLSAALFHNYEGHRRFVIITAYLDESGVHAGSPVTVMSGFVGNVHQWNAFEKEVKNVFKTFKVNGFHARDFLNKSGEYRGWNDEKRILFFIPIQQSMENNLEFGFSVILNNADYEQIYASDPQPAKRQKDSKYGMCFRYALHFLMDMNEKWSNPKWVADENLKFNLVLELGHKNSGDALRIFNEVKTEIDSELLQNISFEDKNCIPLVAADLMAYGTFQVEAPNPAKEKKKMHSKKKIILPYKKNQYSVHISREGLEEHKNWHLQGGSK